jgi:hypothetical protein
MSLYVIEYMYIERLHPYIRAQTNKHVCTYIQVPLEAGLLIKLLNLATVIIFLVRIDVYIGYFNCIYLCVNK